MTPVPSPHSALRERALTWLRGRRSDPDETEDIINALVMLTDDLIEQLETLRLELNHAIRMRAIAEERSEKYSGGEIIPDALKPGDLGEPNPAKRQA